MNGVIVYKWINRYKYMWLMKAEVDIQSKFQVIGENRRLMDLFAITEELLFKCN